MQKNFTIRPMNAENIRECADLFMRTFSKEPWNDVYESEEEVIRFFQRYLNNNCFTGYILTCKDSVIALCLGSRKPWLNGMEYEINQFCVAVCHGKTFSHQAALRLGKRGTGRAFRAGRPASC